MADYEAALDGAVRVLTRARSISVYIGDAIAAEEYVGYALFNETHLIINCEDGRKIFLLRTAVARLEEKPLGSADD